MQLGIVGLGRMGGNIAQRLMRHGHSCVVYDKSAEAVASLAGMGAAGSHGLDELAAKLPAPRAVWLMLPAGKATEDAVTQLRGVLQSGDIVIDGGNTFYKDDVRRARELKTKGIHYVDVGTSGGIWGLDRGYCLMIGGEQNIVDPSRSDFLRARAGLGNIERTVGRDGRDQRPERGYMHCGPCGVRTFRQDDPQRHRVRIDAGLRGGLCHPQGRRLGSATADERYDLDVADIAEVWRRGSVISSWLLDLTAIALAGDPKLEQFSGVVEDSGEGRWTVMAAIEEAVPATVLSAALYARFRSRDDHGFADRLLSAMRKGFGGHIEPKGP